MSDPSSLRDIPPNFDRKKRLIFLIGLCCVGFLVADVLTPIYFENPFLALNLLGVVTAQLTVISVWGTMVRGTFWIRLPWTLLLLVVSWCAFAWGIKIENGRSDTDAMLQTAVLWSFGFVTSFVPLKIAAWCFRWQIALDATYAPVAEQGTQYAIRDILIGTLLLALSMGIGRVMLSDPDIDLTLVLQTSILSEAEPLIAISIYGVVSLLVKLPCIWISLGEKAEKIPQRIGLWAIYCLALAIVEIGLLIAVLGDPGSDAPATFAGLVVGHQVMGAIMLAVCLALRGLGYRLAWSIDRL